MSRTVHLVSAGDAQPRLEDVRSSIFSDDCVVGVGGMVSGASYAMPAVRGWSASQAIRRWANRVIGHEDRLVAWGPSAAMLGCRADRPLTVVLDGMPSESQCKQLNDAMRWADVTTVVGSEQMGACLEVSHHVTPLVSASWCKVPMPADEEDTVTKHWILIEPEDVGSVRSIVPLIGRMSLLGHASNVCISGMARDKVPALMQLNAVGMSDVQEDELTMADLGEGMHVIFPATDRGVVAPVGPALWCYAHGATVMLPREHPAAEWIGSDPGVVTSIDQDPDRALSGIPLAEANRADQVMQWADVCQQMLRGVIGVSV